MIHKATYWCLWCHRDETPEVAP